MEFANKVHSVLIIQDKLNSGYLNTIGTRSKSCLAILSAFTNIHREKYAYAYVNECLV